jgi:hypothetical protein
VDFNQVDVSDELQVLPYQPSISRSEDKSQNPVVLVLALYLLGLYDASLQAWAEMRRSVGAGWHPTNPNVRSH